MNYNAKKWPLAGLKKPDRQEREQGNLQNWFRSLWGEGVVFIQKRTLRDYVGVCIELWTELWYE